MEGESSLFGDRSDLSQLNCCEIHHFPKLTGEKVQYIKAVLLLCSHARPTSTCISPTLRRVQMPREGDQQQSTLNDRNLTGSSSANTSLTVSSSFSQLRRSNRLCSHASSMSTGISPPPHRVVMANKVPLEGYQSPTATRQQTSANDSNVTESSSVGHLAGSTSVRRSKRLCMLCQLYVHMPQPSNSQSGYGKQDAT